MSFHNVEVKFKKKRRKENKVDFLFVFKVDENKTILYKPSSAQEGRNGEFSCNIPFGKKMRRKEGRQEEYKSTNKRIKGI